MLSHFERLTRCANFRQRICYQGVAGFDWESAWWEVFDQKSATKNFFAHPRGARAARAGQSSQKWQNQPLLASSCEARTAFFGIFLERKSNIFIYRYGYDPSKICQTRVLMAYGAPVWGWREKAIKRLFFKVFGHLESWDFGYLHDSE